MEDPYVLHRQVQHRLHNQVLEENNSRHDLIAVQNNFGSFEGHIIEVIQQVMTTFNQFLTAHSQKEQAIYADMVGSAIQIQPNFEWNGFVQRNGNMLIDPNSQDRSLGAISFPNQDHHSTKPLIAGTLERKSRNKLSMSGYTTHYYVVTPSKFLHEYAHKDDLRKDPIPDMSIYLPDATVGATSGEKFNVKGKDVSKGLTSKLSGTSEVSFRAHSAGDAQKWFEVIRATAGAGPTEPYTSAPTSPVESGHPDHQFSGESSTHGEKHPAPLQTQGVAPAKGHGAASPIAGHGMSNPAAAHAAQAKAAGVNVHGVDHAATHDGSSGLAGDKL